MESSKCSLKHPYSLSIHSRCTPSEPGSLLVGGKSHNLSPARNRVAVLRSDGQKGKKKKKENRKLSALILQNCWAGCYGDDPGSTVCSPEPVVFNLLLPFWGRENPPASWASPCSSYVLRNCPRFPAFLANIPSKNVQDLPRFGLHEED